MAKIRSKVVGWKNVLLSQGGQLILLRHVLSSMSMHLLAVLNIPRPCIARSILSWLLSFVGGVNGKQKRMWHSWGKSV